MDGFPVGVKKSANRGPFKTVLLIICLCQMRPDGFYILSEKYLEKALLFWYYQRMKFERDTHLHSREHVLADDLSKMLGEPKRFASYLGIATLYDEMDLRSLARRVIEKNDLPQEARGKYFFACIKGLPKVSGTPRVRQNSRNPKKTTHAGHATHRKKSP